MASQTGSYLARPQPSGLAEVIDIILDKGLVIDAYVRVSLVGIEVLTIDARIVIASVDTYLRFAEAVNRLDLEAKSRDLPEMVEDVTSGASKSKTKGALEGAKDKVKETVGSDDDKNEEEEKQERKPRRKSSSGSRSRSRSGSGSNE